MKAKEAKREISYPVHVTEERRDNDIRKSSLPFKDMTIKGNGARVCVGWGTHKLTDLQRHPQILTCDEFVVPKNRRELSQYN